MLIAIGFPQGLIVVAIAFFLRSSLMNMGQPLIRNISMEIAQDHHRPLMSAMRAMMNNLTRALGIYVGGWLMGTYTYNTPYAFTIVFYMIGTLIFFTLFKNKILKKKTK
jgi:predicted MFS family arabinose efflux permease